MHLVAINFCFFYTYLSRKTSFMQVALNLFAVYEYLSGKSTLPSVISKSSTSTLPIGINDVKSPVLFEDTAVQFFHDSVHLIISNEVCGHVNQ